LFSQKTPIVRLGPVGLSELKRVVDAPHRVVRIAAGHDERDVAFAAALGDGDDVDVCLA